MRRAKLEDKNVVVDIMTESLKNDPHFSYLVEKSKNKNKLRIVMEYLFEESFNKGEIYLNDENTATALWNIKKREKFSLKYAYRKLSLLLKIGFNSAFRVLKMDKLTSQYHPKIGQYAHLHLVGVLPESKGKAYAQKLIKFMIDKTTKNNTELYLETSNSKNISIYNKIGFHVFKTIDMDGHRLFCMNKK